ncbi:MAG: hypothetical protein K8U57_30430 [Planctomycetes bacterium]|nr:hypothetical protein [Planctomycetota bacterium]
MEQAAIAESLAALSAGGERRATEFIRWTNGAYYLELQIDAAGKMSHSTNLPQSVIGKGMYWPDPDDRYRADLTAALEALNTLSFLP